MLRAKEQSKRARTQECSTEVDELPSMKWQMLVLLLNRPDASVVQLKKKLNAFASPETDKSSFVWLFKANSPFLELNALPRYVPDSSQNCSCWFSVESAQSWWLSASPEADNFRNRPSVFKESDIKDPIKFFSSFKYSGRWLGIQIKSHT